MSQGKVKGLTAKKKGRRRKKRAGTDVGNIQHNISVKFGRAVSARRGALGLTQVGLARAVPMNRSHLSELENGKRSPSLELAERIAKALESELIELLKDL
jgi:ribosome-binding protein aMBF1 (putative translation factor)